MSEIDRQFAAFARSLSAKSVTPIALERALHRIGMLITAKAKINAPVDFGHLRNSIFYEVDMKEGGGVLTVGTRGVPYAAIHEFGGVIRPVRARWLTIPIAPWAKYRRASDFNLIRIGRLLVDPDKLGSGDTIPQDAKGFFLARQATIRAKRYFGRSIDESAPTIVKILRELGNGK